LTRKSRAIAEISRVAEIKNGLNISRASFSFHAPASHFTRQLLISPASFSFHASAIRLLASATSFQRGDGSVYHSRLMKRTRLALFTLVLGASIGSAPPVQERLVPIDPQRVQDQDTMTWKDYRPIPGATWADPTRRGERVFRVALIAVDFEDQPFVITQTKGSDLRQPAGRPREARRCAAVLC
jgi:hypothetical protein